jgi:hypothetical protein
VLARSLCATLLLAAGAADAAEPPLPGGIPDLAGPRALALSASVGVAAGNEGIFVNPAAIGVRRRYTVEGGIMVDRRGAETASRLYGASVVDSISSPAAVGISYLRADEGLYTGNVWHGAIAGPIAEGFHLGVSAKYLSVDPGDAAPVGARSSDAVTMDAGIFWQVASLVSVGAAGYNLVSIANEAIAPMGAGVGVGIGSDQSFQITADWRADFDRAGETTNRYAAGVEVLLGRLIPIRAGWMKDETLDGQWWSAGAGLISQGGVALDVGYRQSLDTPSARTIAATLKMFLFR